MALVQAIEGASEQDPPELPLVSRWRFLGWAAAGVSRVCPGCARAIGTLCGTGVWQRHGAGQAGTGNRGEGPEERE